VSFLLKDIHAHDVVTVADQRGVALRGGHHCNQPLMRKLGVESTARASFYFYNTTEEIDRFVEVLGEIQKFFAGCLNGAKRTYRKMTETEVISAQSTMSQVLEAYPGAQRALFRRYHIGGCSSCAFRPDETLEQVCERNGGLNVDEVLQHIKSSHEQDAKIFIAPKELAEWRKQDSSVRLVDVRSREEFEAVHLEGSLLLSQDVMRQVMAEGSNTRPLVIVDHQGKQALDAAAYFMGHGLQNVRCLRGGIDAWSQEVDSRIRRYRLGE
jgi:rhodanese-related sulfurtransferase